MWLIPTIDIKQGQCVRLRQGRMDEVTVFSEDPVAMARHWFEQGCRRLHLVDLDGAVEGAPRNAGLIRRICEVAGEVPVQVGGGIRDLAGMQAYFEAGVSQVIIGTQAVKDPGFLESACTTYPQRVILGLDARDGLIATEGWGETSNVRALEFARSAGTYPLFAVVYTDIARDGMGTGLNAVATLALAEHSGLPVIASGGVNSLTDLEAFQRAASASPGKILGVITGRALYEGSLQLQAGQALLDRLSQG